jgi:hypothetical protein
LDRLPLKMRLFLCLGVSGTDLQTLGDKSRKTGNWLLIALLYLNWSTQQIIASEVNKFSDCRCKNTFAEFDAFWIKTQITLLMLCSYRAEPVLWSTDLLVSQSLLSYSRNSCILSNRRLITVFTNASRWSLHLNEINSVYILKPYFLRSILMLPSRLQFILPGRLFLSVFKTEMLCNFVCCSVCGTFPSHRVWYMPLPSHIP